MKPKAGRVLVIHNHLGPVGGVETHVLAEIAALRQAGYTVAIFALSAAATPKDENVWIYWRRPPGQRVRKLLSYLVHPGIAIALWTKIRSFRPDWIHLHTSEQPFTILPILAGQRVVHTIHITGLACPLSTLYYQDTLAQCPGGIGVRCVHHQCLSVPGLLPRLLTHRLHQWLINRVVTVTTAPSPSLAQLLNRRAHLRTVVPVPLFPSLPGSPSANHREGDLILYVGVLSRPKGPEWILHALPRIRAVIPAARLALVGDGPQRADLERLACDLGVDNAVQFVGRLEHDKLTTWYDRAAVCVIPSIVGETFCLVAYEALARNCPVIATPRGALPDVIEDGVTGLLVEPTNTTKLAEAVSALLSDPERAGRLARAGNARVRSGNTATGFLARLESLIRTAP